VDLVVASVVFAGRADLRRLLAVVHVAAVPALPLDLTVPLEDGASLHVCQQLPVPFLVLFLDLSYLSEGLRHVFEPLPLRRLSEARIQGPPLQLLSLGRG